MTITLTAPFRRRTLPGAFSYGGLAPVSRCYPPPEGRLATCYSAVRHAPRRRSVRLPWLSPTPIAVGAGRINRSWEYGAARASRACTPGSTPVGPEVQGVETPLTSRVPTLKCKDPEDYCILGGLKILRVSWTCTRGRRPAFHSPGYARCRSDAAAGTPRAIRNYSFTQL